MKKIFTTILSILLIATCFTINTFADEVEGTQTENNAQTLEVTNETTKTLGSLSSDDQRIINCWYSNGVYNWIILEDPSSFYSENPITINLECSNNNFSKAADAPEEVTFQRSENTITATLSKYEVSRFIVGEGEGSELHEFNVVPNHEKSFLAKLDGHFGLEVEKGLSEFDNKADKFKVLSLILFLDNNDYNTLYEKIETNNLDNIESDIYSISFKNNSSASKECGIGVINGNTLPYIIYQVSSDGYTENIVLYFKPSAPVFDLGSYDEVKIVSSNKTVTLSTNNYQEIDGKRYYKPENAFFDENEVKIQFKKNGQIVDELLLENNQYSENGIDYKIQGIEVYDIQSGCIVVLCSNYEIDAPVNHSFIKPTSNNYDLYKEEGQEKYFWTFNLSFNDFISNEHDVTFINNTDEKITFIQDTTNSSDLYDIEKNDGKFTIKSLDNNQSAFIATKNGVDQVHFIDFNCNDNEEIMRKTVISSFESEYGNLSFDLFSSVYNQNTGLFDSVHTGLYIPTSSLSSLINNIESGNQINLQDYFNISFVDGWTVNGEPMLRIETGYYGRMVHITYNVQNGHDSQIVNIFLEKATNEESNSMVNIEGKNYFLEEYGDTKVYISESQGPSLNLSVEDIVNAANNDKTKHDVLFLDYSVQNLGSDSNYQSPLIYVDGYEMKEDQKVSLNLYYLNDPTLLDSNNIRKENLTKINTFNKPIKVDFVISNYEYHDGSEKHQLLIERRLPYRINKGNYSYPLETTDTNTNNQQSINTWLSYNIDRGNEKIAFDINIKFLESGEVTYYREYYKEPGESINKVTLYLGGQNVEGEKHYSATDAGLKAAMDDLRDGYKSSIVLLEDVTLKTDVYLKHDLFAPENPEKTAEADVNINLNGHSINTNGHSIINLRNSAIHITNTIIDDTNSSGNNGGRVYGDSNNPLIINYGYLYVFDNVTFENSLGTAILSYNSGDGYIAPNATVNAKVCLQLEENELFADGRMNSHFIVRGKLRATDIAIISNSRESEIINKLDLDFYDENFNNHKTIISDKIGIKTSGNVDLYVYGFDIIAEKPYEISGGDIEIRNSNAKALKMSTYGSSSESLSKNPVIFVNSKDPYANGTSVLLATENHVNMQTGGEIIKEVSDSGSKIDEVYFYSINSKDESYFDYAKLFDFTPRSDAYICIEGGCFSDDSFKDYIPGSSSNIQQTEDKKYYFYNKDCYREVGNYTELVSALQDVNIQDIKLSASISAPSPDSTIEFVVNAPKVLFLNGHNIQNVHFIAKTTNDDAAKAFFTIEGYSKSENNNTSSISTISNSGIVIESSVNETFIKDVNITSTGNAAIKVYGGRMYVRGERFKPTAEGLQGIVVDDSFDSLSISNIDVSNYQVLGKKGPAIEVNSTDRFVYLNIFNSLIKTELNDGSIASSAIRIKDQIRVTSMGNSIIQGGKYGVYFDDGISGDGFVNCFADLQISKTNVSADIAFRMGNNTTAYLSDGTDVVATSTMMEIHGFTQYVITSGNYNVTDKDNGKIIDFIGVSPTANYNWHNIQGGNYSHFVKNEWIFNSSDWEYQYRCVKVDTIDNKNLLPYKVVRRKKDAKNYESIEVPIKKDIVIDSDRLDNAFNETGSGIDVVLTVKYKNDSETKNKFDGHGKGFKEYYDIHVDKSINGEPLKGINETDNYQLITISLNNISEENIIYTNVENVKVYHQHNGTISTLKKINKSNAKNANEECYYISNENGQWCLNIITKQFSDFAIQEIGSNVPEQSLKGNYVLNLNYESIYSGYTENLPTSATYGDNGRISIDDVDVVYTNVSGNYYYSNTFPSNVGEYKVEWTVKDGKDITGKGSDTFTILDVDFKDITPKNNLVYNGNLQNLISDIDDIDKYRFEVINSEGETTIFDGEEIPQAKDAGEYTINYSKNGIEHELCKVTISKANLSVEPPTDLVANRGDKLSSIEVEGWTWINENNFVSDSNLAKYNNPDPDNYNDVIINLPIKITQTINNITVTITNNVKDNDGKIGEFTIVNGNNSIIDSVMDVLSNDNSLTKMSDDLVEFIRSASSDIDIDTNILKDEKTLTDIPNTAKDKVNTIVGDNTVEMVLDLKVKITAKSGSVTKEGLITELASPEPVTIKLPEGAKTVATPGNELKYYVLVIHDGDNGEEIIRVNARLNPDGTISFSAGKFSTYVIVCEESPINNQTNNPGAIPGYRKPVVNTSSH